MQYIEAGNYSANQIISFIQTEASKAVDYIENVINDYDNTSHQSEHYSDVLKIEDLDSFGQRINTLRDQYGLYVFEVAEDFHLTYKDVVDYNNLKGSGFNIWSDKDLLKGDHFYQGSATSKSLQSRMGQHFSSNKDSEGIRLNHPNRSIVKDKLRLYIFPVKKELKDEAFFIKMIEAELHKRFHPATGSTRV